jgi:hypothetical protein
MQQQHPKSRSVYINLNIGALCLSIRTCSVVIFFKMAIVSMICCVGCQTIRHQIRDSAPHATICIWMRDARVLGIWQITLDGKVIPIENDVSDSYRIRPGVHALVVERRILVKDEHPDGKLLSDIVKFIGTAATRSGRLGWSDTSMLETSNVTEKVIFRAENNTSYIWDCWRSDWSPDATRPKITN